jgi:hypothetical protein
MVVSTPVPKMQVVFTPGCSSRVTFTTFSNMACPCAEFFLLPLGHTIQYLEYLRPNWLPPPPLSQASVSPLVGTWGGNTRLAGEGAGEPIRTTGEKVWHSVYCSVYSVLP